MIKETFRIASSNKTSRLMVTVWKPEGTVHAILQISHGMIDHIGRYEELAYYLTKRGFLIVGNDHIGHGQTACGSKDYGYFTAGSNSTGAETVLKDLYRVMKQIKKDYPNQPYFLLGHSMGSFFARSFALRYSSELDGILLSGTGDFPFLFLYFNKLLIYSMSSLFGSHYHSNLLSMLLNFVNNRKFHPCQTPSDWLSKDRKKVWEYVNDPYCQFNFTLNGYSVLLDILAITERAEQQCCFGPHVNKEFRRTLPIAFFSGSNDPVGNYGSAVKKVYQRYRKMGCENTYLKLYPTDRHELFNETDRKEVFRQMDECLEKFLRLKQ